MKAHKYTYHLKIFKNWAIFPPIQFAVNCIPWGKKKTKKLAVNGEVQEWGNHGIRKHILNPKHISGWQWEKPKEQVIHFGTIIQGILGEYSWNQLIALINCYYWKPRIVRSNVKIHCSFIDEEKEENKFK